MKMKEIKTGFGEGLPWWQYFFCDGRIIVGAKDKGISQISYVGNQPIQSQDFFKREISFFQDGKQIFFEKIDIFPFGFINNYYSGDKNYSYWMVIEGEKIVFCFSEGERKKLEVIIPKDSLVKEIDAYRVLYEGLIYVKGENSLYFHAKDFHKISGPDSVREKTAGMLQEISTPKLPPLEITGETFGAICSETSFDLKEDNEKYILTWERVQEGDFTFAFLFGKSLNEMKNAKKEYLKDPTGCFSRQTERYKEKAKNLPEFYSFGSLNTGNYRNLSRFFRMQPLYLESMKIDDIGAFRADNAYYWAWGWDVTLPCFGLLSAGDYESVKNALIFLNKTAGKDGSIGPSFTSDFQHYHTRSIGENHNTSFLILIDRYFSLTNDMRTLKKLASQIEEIFTGISSICDETGFYLTRGGATDNPEEFGRTAYGFVSFEMGFWYNALLSLERIFPALNKRNLFKKAGETARKIEKNFLRTFYNEELGYLHEGVHPENCPFGLAGETNDTSLIANIGCMLSLYGENLIWEKEEEIADFCEKEFLKDDGIHYKPIWEKRGYYGWTRIGENWFPCADIYLARLLRKAGKGKALEKMMNLYEETFAFYNAVFEGKTVSVKNPKPLACPGKWQAFASSAWYRVIVEAFSGIEIDEGGLTYIPADLNLDMRLQKLRFDETYWDIEITGRGSYVEGFIIDGKEIKNTLKIPANFYTSGEHSLIIKRSPVFPENPVLLEAVNAKVKKVKSGKRYLSINLESKRPIMIKFFSPEPISLIINGQKICHKWSEKRNTGLVLISGFAKKDCVGRKY